MSKYVSYVSHSQEETADIASKIDSFLNIGDVVILSGDLGAGKTELVRAILRLKNVKSRITSPTFTIVNEYFGDNNEHFYHLDLYRIEDEDEVRNIDYEEILDDDTSIKFIEWAERAEDYLPKKYKKIMIEKLGESTRKITFQEVSQ